jgi:hypothetical protein
VRGTARRGFPQPIGAVTHSSRISPWAPAALAWELRPPAPLAEINLGNLVPTAKL